MFNPLALFVKEGRRLTDIVRDTGTVPEEQLPDFVAHNKRVDFLRDVVARTAVLAHCYDRLCELAAKLDQLQERVDALPPDPHTSSEHMSVRMVPEELTRAEEQYLVEADAATSLIYYETKSLVDLIRQLGVTVDPASEVHYLVKVRDRFLAHARRSGVARGSVRDYRRVPPRGFLEYDVVALNSWSLDELRQLGKRALQIGSTVWQEQRRKNEELVLSSKHNEQFTDDEKLALLAAGVRECKLETALHQLGRLLEDSVLPIVSEATDEAIRLFAYERVEWDDEVVVRQQIT